MLLPAWFPGTSSSCTGGRCSPRRASSGSSSRLRSCSPRRRLARDCSPICTSGASRTRSGGRVDAKMFLYLVGAMMLELNVLSFAAHHSSVPDDPRPASCFYAALFTFFLSEYLNFERVHLYTYDFVAERVGFKLGWGCLVFYPFFYCIGLWSAAERPNPHAAASLLVACGAVLLRGWVLARGANLQKFPFKTRPGARSSSACSPPRGARRRRAHAAVQRLLGLSRHVNYLGEILMALGLALSLGYPAIWPWLYPLYYVVLLVPRQIDDDRRCAAEVRAALGGVQARGAVSDRSLGLLNVEHGVSGPKHGFASDRGHRRLAPMARGGEDRLAERPSVRRREREQGKRCVAMSRNEREAKDEHRGKMESDR